MPTHPIVPPEGTDVIGANSFGTISAAPYGSASVLSISWAYIKMMGFRGLRKSTQVRFCVLCLSFLFQKLDLFYLKIHFLHYTGSKKSTDFTMSYCQKY